MYEKESCIFCCWEHSSLSGSSTGGKKCRSEHHARYDPFQMLCGPELEVELDNCGAELMNILEELQDVQGMSC